MAESPTEGMTPDEIVEMIKSNGEAVARTCLEYLKSREHELDDKSDAVAARLLRHINEVDVDRQAKHDQQALQSLKISEASAIASQRSARWTMVAALVALASVLIPLAEKHHWFGL